MPLVKGTHYANAVRDFQRNYWCEMLKVHGSIAAAARAAGVNRTSTYRMFASLGLMSGIKKPHRGNWGAL
jgi:molybdenum-dependent DNA-binding transcriptional regulator ModE